MTGPALVLHSLSPGFCFSLPPSPPPYLECFPRSLHMPPMSSEGLTGPALGSSLTREMPSLVSRHHHLALPCLIFNCSSIPKTLLVPCPASPALTSLPSSSSIPSPGYLHLSIPPQAPHSQLLEGKTIPIIQPSSQACSLGDFPG